MNIGDYVLIKGKIKEIRQTETGYIYKIAPEYKDELSKNLDMFLIRDEAVINETDAENREAEYFLSKGLNHGC